MDADCEPAAVYTKTFPKARKPTRCQACHETAPAGVKYARIGILTDGSWDIVKRCLRCEAIHSHLVGLCGDHDTWPNDRLKCGHRYEDLHGRPPPDDIAALAFALPGEVTL